jgi:hypothetical protein
MVNRPRMDCFAHLDWPFHDAPHWRLARDLHGARAL